MPMLTRFWSPGQSRLTFVGSSVRIPGMDNDKLTPGPAMQLLPGLLMVTSTIWLPLSVHFWVGRTNCTWADGAVDFHRDTEKICSLPVVVLVVTGRVIECRGLLGSSAAEYSKM